MNEPTTSNSAEQLPAFLRRRNGVLELVLHCTWIQDYYVCPRKFWLRYDACVEATGPRAALNYGSGAHTGLKVRHQGGNLDAVLEAVDKHFAANPQPEDDYRSPGRCKDLMRAYHDEYPTEEWQVLAVEEEFEVRVGEINARIPMVGPDGSVISDWTAMPCFLAGRKDLVVTWHGGLWVVDHKTAQDWGGGENTHLLEGRRSFQFKGYAWAERVQQEANGHEAYCSDYLHGAPEKESPRLSLPVLGAVGNYLISRRPLANPDAKPKAGTKPRNEFHRECYPFEPAVLDEWRDEFMDAAECIMRDWTCKRWAAHDTGCGHWGRCEFYDYCEESPERRDDLLNSSMFREKDFSHIGGSEE